MRMIIATLFMFLLSWNAKAQDPVLDIVGESYWEICAPWCHTFDLYLDTDYTWENVTISVTPPNGALLTMFGDSIFELCIELPGTYLVTATGFAFDSNSEFLVSDSIVIYANDYFINGEIYTSACPGDSVKRGECFKACEYSEATYFVNFNGQTIDGNWFVQGAQSYVDNLTSVDVIWGESGMGYVEFFPYSSICNSEPISACVDILPTPEPLFNSIPAANNSIIQLCTGQPLYLENLSQHASRYEWVFGDGTTSELFEPEHMYTTPGLYTIGLTAYNMCDCEETYYIEVEVLPAPAPELSCVATVCPDDKVRYVASTDGCQTFYWTVSSNGSVLSGGGLSDDFIEVEWGDGPDGIIELLVEDCNQPYCSKPAIFRVPIVSENGPISGDDLVCSGELVTYKAPYFPGVTYNWTTSALATIVSGQNTNAVSVQWANVNSTQTNQSINVTYGHCYLGCEGADQFDVSIVPNMSISSDGQFCELSDGVFSSHAGFFSQSDVVSNWKLYNSAGTVIWSSGASDDEITLTLNFPPGDYTMVATPVNPTDVCQSEVERDFIITALPEKPLSILGDSFICPGLPYAFESDNAGNYQTHWTIIDGVNTINYDGQIITHTFGNTPPYIVEAAHSDLIYPSCVSDNISRTILPATTAQIVGADENCLEENSIYEVYELPGNILEWRVEPSDMAEVSNKNSKQAEFYWVKDGNAQVILSVCGQDIIKNVLINPLPVPVVSYPTGLCKNEVAHVSTTFDFEAQTWYDSSGTVISIDSTTALYPGYYSVDVVDVNGCIGTTSFEIEFYPTPTARISTLGANGHCNVVDPIELVANTDGVNYSYQWLHNGNPVGMNSPKYMADTFGFFQVVATNQYGCEVISNAIRVFNWCDSKPGVCSNYACTYYGDLIIDNSEVDCNTKKYNEVSGLLLEPGTISWDIENSDGFFVNIPGQNIEHTFVDAGYYTVVVTARLDGFAYPQLNCQHLIHIKDTVELASRFEYHGACANSVIEFEDLSTFLPDYGITAWAWDFGDGATSSDQHPTHTYTNPGIYNVQLVTTSTSGCTSTIEQDVEVFAPPSLNIISIAEACEGNPVEFEVQSSQKLFDITWDFLDPSSSNNDAESKIAFHTYEDGGQYFPNVTATNIYTCTASTSTVVEIFDNNLAGDISSLNGTLLCAGETTELTAPNGGVVWEWNTTENTESITINEAGHYEVLLEDDHGCQYKPDPIFIEIQPKPIATINGREIFGPGDVGAWTDTVETCQGVDIELMTFANANVTYSWSTTATTSSISFTDESGTLLPPGAHIFSVVVTDVTTNCVSDPVDIVVIVHDNPMDFTVSVVSGTSCSETVNVLQVDNVQAGVTYTWSDGQEGSQIEAFEQGIYTVLATNEFGCTTESINSVFIKPSPRADLVPSGCFVRCNPDTICIPHIENVSYYEIRLDNVVQESGVNLPDEFIATQSGSYEFYLESNNGCSATSQPLDLELYPGYGHVDIAVFVDVNGNGIVDPADTTISGVIVQLFENNVVYDMLPTDINGSAYFLNVPAGSYVVQIDTNSIPGGLTLLISDVPIEIIGCDIDYTDTLALTPCIVDVFETAYLCPGDSLQLADTVFFPTGDFNYYFSGNGTTCDTNFTVTVMPDTTVTLIISTYVDVDNNGLISSADSLIGNIDLIITDANNIVSNLNTDNNGQLNHSVVTGMTNIVIDTALLSGDWEVVIGDTTFNTAPCSDIIIELLIAPASPPIQLSFDRTLCPGDSVLIDGQYYYAAEIVEVLVTGGPQDTIKYYTITEFSEIEVEEIFTDACEGENNGMIDITASSLNGNVSISWNHSATTDFLLENLTPNTYGYTLNDGSCSVEGEIELEEYIFPALNVAVQDPSCPGTSDGQINVSLASLELSWSLDQLNYTTNDFSDLTAGTYTVYFTNGNCIQTETITLKEKEIDEFVIQTIIDVPVNTTYQLTHNYIDSLTHLFDWSPASYLDCSDCPSPTFTGTDQDMTVFVVVTDNEGCEQSAEILLRADQSQHIFIPNAFSPNDDAINDRFKPFVREGVVATERLEIFDRWGNRVYQEELGVDELDIEGWDGKQNGNSYLPGLFIYKADFIYANGTPKQVTGEVHLIR